MMRRNGRALSLLPAVLLGGLPSAASDTPAPKTVAFVHTAVVPMDTERVLRDQTVVVANGKIVAMGPAPVVSVPADAHRVDGRGRYLLPGLCDMHVHLPGPAWKAMLPPERQDAAEALPYEDLLFPYVASGVTTVQALSATPEEVALRKAIEKGDIVGPRLILGRMIDGPRKAWPPPISTWVASPEEAREAVRQAKADGYDKIKVYSFLDKASYDAIVAAADELDLDVIGHIPMSLSLEYVLDAGQKLIAHSEEVAKHARGDYRRERIEYFADTMSERGVWMIPTLATTRAIVELYRNPDAVLQRPEARFNRHPLQQAIWTFVAYKLYVPTPTEARQRIRSDFEQFQRPLTKALSAKGGKLMAGSDTILPGLVAGFALHRELREMVDAGLTPFQALRASTTSPFEYLRESDRAGTIEVGKQTDLLLLEANPLQDVAAAAKIDGVLIRGRWIGPQEIQRRMRTISSLPNGVSPAQ
jgi:imidazolonepropionase-like amidohydrolase